MPIPCKVCGEPSTHIFYCEEHFKCADCGTKGNLFLMTGGLLCGNCHTKRVNERIEKGGHKTQHTSNIVCPICGHVFINSWEIHDDSGTLDCEDCGSTFFYERYVDISYCTKKV